MDNGLLVLLVPLIATVVALAFTIEAGHPYRR